MAIKISNTTVIDDSRNLTNAGTVTANSFVGDGSQLTNVAGPVRVLKPENIFPANAATAAFNTTLCGSPYYNLYSKPHTCSCFEVSECSDFSTCNVFTCEIAAASRSITIPNDCLAVDQQYFFRLRYEDADGCCSEFSDATCFTTELVPSVLGESICGGFYTGTINVSGQCYYLIVAPNASGCACCQWKCTSTCSNIGRSGIATIDGFRNTYTYMCSFIHRAGNWARTRNINGFTDWYLPAQCELRQLYLNQSCMPAGEGLRSNFNHWTSTEYNYNRGRSMLMCTGVVNYTGCVKSELQPFRAFRRVPFL